MTDKQTQKGCNEAHPNRTDNLQESPHSNLSWNLTRYQLRQRPITGHVSPITILLFMKLIVLSFTGPLVELQGRFMLSAGTGTLCAIAKLRL